MGKSLIYGSDAEMKALESRLKAGSVKGQEAIAYLTKLLPLLRKRTKKLAAAETFVQGVANEDRLYVAAWSVWRRRVVTPRVGHEWVRANAPQAFNPSYPPTETFSAAEVVTPKDRRNGT